MFLRVLDAAAAPVGITCKHYLFSFDVLLVTTTLPVAADMQVEQ